MGRGPHALGITQHLSELVQHPGLFLEASEEWLSHAGTTQGLLEGCKNGAWQGQRRLRSSCHREAAPGPSALRARDFFWDREGQHERLPEPEPRRRTLV